jgi:hypothetical protein
VRLGREAHHIADRPNDLRGQYGTYAEDLGESGAGSLYLRFDAPVEVRDLSIQRTDVAQDFRNQPPAEAGRGAFLGPYAAEDARGSAGAVLREGSALDEPADFVDHRDGDRRFMGIDPDQDLHERTSVSVGPLPIGARRTFRLRALLPYLF